MNKLERTEGGLKALYEKEEELEKSLMYVREQIRETINYLDKNKVKE